jgi:hypothetical protein
MHVLLLPCYLTPQQSGSTQIFVSLFYFSSRMNLFPTGHILCDVIDNHILIVPELSIQLNIEQNLEPHVVSILTWSITWAFNWS